MKKIFIFLYFSSCLGMDFIARTRVESPFSLSKRDALYESKRDELLCSYKCLYPEELLTRHAVKERDEMIVATQNDLEQRIAHLKKQLIEELWIEGAGLASTASNGIAFYYSDNIMTLVGFLVSLMGSAIYLEDTLLWTRASVRFNSHYLKKFKTVELIKNLEIVISDNYEEK